MSARDALLARLDAMLAATPPPPSGDPDALVDAFAAIARDRAEILVELAVLASASADDPEVRERHLLIAQRDRIWLDALGTARETIDARLGAVRRARAYSR